MLGGGSATTNWLAVFRWRVGGGHTESGCVPTRAAKTDETSVGADSRSDGCGGVMYGFFCLLFRLICVLLLLSQSNLIDTAGLWPGAPRHAGMTGL